MLIWDLTKLFSLQTQGTESAVWGFCWRITLSVWHCTDGGVVFFFPGRQTRTLQGLLIRCVFFPSLNKSLMGTQGWIKAHSLLPEPNSCPFHFLFTFHRMNFDLEMLAARPIISGRVGCGNNPHLLLFLLLFLSSFFRKVDHCKWNGNYTVTAAGLPIFTTLHFDIFPVSPPVRDVTEPQPQTFCCYSFGCCSSFFLKSLPSTFFSINSSVLSSVLSFPFINHFQVIPCEMRLEPNNACVLACVRACLRAFV